MNHSRSIALAAACAATIAWCSIARSAPLPNNPSSLTVPSGFALEAVAQVPSARELATLPNGDLLVGTSGRDVFIVPSAEGTPGPAEVFATLPDSRAAGVAFAAGPKAIYIGTEHGVYVVPYHDGDRKASKVRLLAHVRTGPIAPDSDGDVHVTTSVAYAGGTLYASVGSSCNACAEVDSTRAAILAVPVDGGQPIRRATRIRNAIALAVNPVTQALWAGDAGQDNLPFGHPYEFLDDVTAHTGVADYGWPACEEDHHAYTPGANCAGTVAPLIEAPAYGTFIGAVFYPDDQRGAHVFPKAYRGTLFATMHGSWHRTASGDFAAEPVVIMVPMTGDRPRTPVSWNDPHAQWQTFLGGFQPSGTVRVGRPTGIAVGAQGSLFVAEDSRGLVYRIRSR
jgi:glucose/arabinose dehydrogenase